MTSSRSATSKSRIRSALEALGALLAVAVLATAAGFFGRLTMTELGAQPPTTASYTRVILNNGCTLTAGSGTPEGVLSGSPCDVYLRTNGAAGTVLYAKETGTATTTGWIAYAGGAGSFAPVGATYLTQTADGTLTAEQALAALASGYMKITTGTGVVASQAVPIPAADGGTGVVSTATFPSSGVVTTDAGSSTLTNKTLDAEGTGNVLTIPWRIWYGAALCQNATASSDWSLPATDPAVATCDSGTNTQKATLDFADGVLVLSAQRTIALPADFTGAIDVRIKWYTSAIAGDVVWQVATTCVADAETGDPAFNTASTVTDTAKGTTLQYNDAAIAGVTATGCAAGEMLYLKVVRDPAHASDTLAATARLVGLEITLRRGL